MCIRDRQGSATHIGAIKTPDSCFTLFPAAQGYKGKAARPAGFAVQGDMQINYPSKVFELGADFVFGSGEGQIAHVEFHLCCSVRQSSLNDGYTF